MRSARASRPGSIRRCLRSVRFRHGLLIVGLAPGLQGANRTGRPFTGDYAGVLLYDTLARYGFARGVYQAHPDDGLELVDARIANGVRCVPPQNKPLPAEIATCRTFLKDDIAAMPSLRAIVALGRIAHDTVVKVLEARLVAVPFSHGGAHDVGPLRLFELSLLALQHEHRRADAGNVPRRVCCRARLSRPRLKPGEARRSPPRHSCPAGTPDRTPW